MDLIELLALLRDNGTISSIVNNPRAQFGTPQRRYVGALILPERPVAANMYREESITYRTIVANDGTRYSPVQKKKSAFVGSMLVTLAEQDIGSELTSQEFDTLRRLLGTGGDMQATAQLTRFLDVTLVRALTEKVEKMRWEAIVGASVPIRGDNNYTDTINYSNPTNSRVTAASAFDDDDVDPFDTVMERAEFLRAKGVEPRAIYTSSAAVARFTSNAKVKARVGPAFISAAGQVTGASGYASLGAVNAALVGMNLPPLMTYDLQYRLQTGTARFLPATTLVMVGSTNRDENVDLGDRIETVSDVLGYVGVGVAAGQSTTGRVAFLNAFLTSKPPRIEGEAWQTTLPVIQEPDSIAVVNGV